MADVGRALRSAWFVAAPPLAVTAPLAGSSLQYDEIKLVARTAYEIRANPGSESGACSACGALLVVVVSDSAAATVVGVVSGSGSAPARRLWRGRALVPPRPRWSQELAPVLPPQSKAPRRAALPPALPAPRPAREGPRRLAQGWSPPRRRPLPAPPAPPARASTNGCDTSLRFLLCRTGREHARQPTNEL